MSRTELEAEALKLPFAERARLVETLLRSLDSLSKDEAEALWLEEAERRDVAMDAGEVGREAADVMRGVRARLS